MSVPSQSQSSPIIHFTSPIRSRDDPAFVISPSSSEEHLSELLARPQSTPIALRSIDENCFLTRRRRHRLTHNSQCVVSFDLDDDRYCLRPPPLLVLSQSIQAKHPEQLNETKLNHRFSAKKDLPTSLANYSLVFYGFNPTQLAEGRRLSRRMGDCFTSETIDLLTTHVVLPDEQHCQSMVIHLDLILSLIYRCRLVTFDWLKCSSRTGEWLNESRFIPKALFAAHPSLNVYRRSSSMSIFQSCGSIYLTSLVDQRALLLKLMTLLGADITVNRDRAKISVGRSSKSHPVFISPQLDEQWAIDSIQSGKCLSFETYLLSHCV